MALVTDARCGKTVIVTDDDPDCPYCNRPPQLTSSTNEPSRSNASTPLLCRSCAALPAEPGGLCGICIDALPVAAEVRVSIDGRSWPLQASLALGRDPRYSSAADTLERYIDVSRQHCRLTLTGGTIYIEDERSTNGTWVNDRRLAAGVRVEVRLGDCIRLGDDCIVVLSGAP